MLRSFKCRFFCRRIVVAARFILYNIATKIPTSWIQIELNSNSGNNVTIVVVVGTTITAAEVVVVVLVKQQWHRKQVAIA